MRASLSVSKVGSSVAKDPDILEKLDPRGMLAITQRYQSHFKHCAGQRDKMRGVKFLLDLKKFVIGYPRNLTTRSKTF